MANEKLEMDYEKEIEELNQQISWLEDSNERLRNQIIEKEKEKELQWYRGFKEATCMIFGGKKNDK